MAIEFEAMADPAAYDFRGQYRFGSQESSGDTRSLAEIAERACADEPGVLAFATRAWRPSASALSVYAEYIMGDDSVDGHRRLLALIHGESRRSSERPEA